MIRVLYIARLRNAVMERKIGLMAAHSDVDIWLVRPSRWRDEYVDLALPSLSSDLYQTRAVPLLGTAKDHHRVLYRTLSFGMRSVRPHIIHAEEEPDSLAGLQIAIARRLFAPSALLVLHTWQNVNRDKGWHVWAVLRATLSQADAVLCASREAVSVLSELGYKGPSDVILQEGVNRDVFYPQPKEPSTGFVVLYAGRLAPEKGVEDLLMAVSLLGENVRLKLVGEGPARPMLEHTADALGLRDQVEFAGAVPVERMPAVLSQADVLVLPSRTMPKWKEQFGRVLVEAMACKVPVVGSDSGEIPNVIGDAGLIFPEGDVQALAQCLSRVRNSQELRDQLIDRGYARVERLYSQEIVAQQTVAFYRRLVG